jgi:hypothetical protein
MVSWNYLSNFQKMDSRGFWIHSIYYILRSPLVFPITYHLLLGIDGITKLESFYWVYCRLQVLWTNHILAKKHTIVIHIIIKRLWRDRVLLDQTGWIILLMNTLFRFMLHFHNSISIYTQSDPHSSGLLVLIFSRKWLSWRIIWQIIDIKFLRTCASPYYMDPCSF